MKNVNIDTFAQFDQARKSTSFWFCGAKFPTNFPKNNGLIISICPLNASHDKWSQSKTIFSSKINILSLMRHFDHFQRLQVHK